LELYDDEFGCEIYKAYNIAVAETGRISAEMAEALDQVAGIVEGTLCANQLPFVLGGEHSLTIGAIRPLAKRFPGLVIVHFDAHADLRDGYMGEHYSHAATMRRVLDNEDVSLVSLGIRAISAVEAEFAERNRKRVQIYWAKDKAEWDVEAIVRPLTGRPTYISFDVDALDAAVMPATGTPVPGGLSYNDALKIVRNVASVSRVVGLDLVEFAPIKGLHACDYTAAALAYKMLSYALALPNERHR
jgi:agmatinase